MVEVSEGVGEHEQQRAHCLGQARRRLCYTHTLGHSSFLTTNTRRGLPAGYSVIVVSRLPEFLGFQKSI